MSRSSTNAAEPEVGPMMTIDIGFIPLWVREFHRQITLGNGDAYRETPTRAITSIVPLPSDIKNFPYLHEVEEVYLVYTKR